jgi:hypothetical protein
VRGAHFQQDDAEGDKEDPKGGTLFYGSSSAGEQLI